LSRKKPVEKRSAGIAYVKMPGGGRRETHTDGSA